VINGDDVRFCCQMRRGKGEKGDKKGREEEGGEGRDKEKEGKKEEGGRERERGGRERGEGGWREGGEKGTFSQFRKTVTNGHYDPIRTSFRLQHLGPSMNLHFHRFRGPPPPPVRAALPALYVHGLRAPFCRSLCVSFAEFCPANIAGIAVTTGHRTISIKVQAEARGFGDITGMCVQLRSRTIILPYVPISRLPASKNFSPRSFIALPRNMIVLMSS